MPRLASGRVCGQIGAVHQSPGDDSCPEGVIETSQRRNNGKPVQEGEISAENEGELKNDDNRSGQSPRINRPEDKPRREQFGKMVEDNPELKQKSGAKSETTD